MSNSKNSQDDTALIFSITSLSLACISMIGGLFVGICVFPIIIISIILAVMGFKNGTSRILAIISLSLNGFMILLVICIASCTLSAIAPFLAGSGIS